MENIEKINNHNVRNKVIIAIVCILGLCTLVLTIYKYYYEKDFEYEYNELSNIKRQLQSVSTDDYKEKIIEEDVTSYNYMFTSNNKTVIGKIYIADDYKLYVVDDNTNTFHKVSDITFKTIFIKMRYADGLYIYLISTDNQLYLYSLDTADIKDSRIEKFDIDFKVKNFVNIEYKYDDFEPVNSIFVLSTDNIIYDAFSGIKYNNEIICLNRKYLVYSDNTISDVSGNMFMDSFNDYYKIKYIFYIHEYDIPFDSIIITEDNRLIYFEEEHNLIREIKDKIKNIEMENNGKYESSKLKITFESGKSMYNDASYGDYFALYTQ